jgi:protein-S-isoprenylcysteine O-methyltransferase Ste14
MLPRPAIYLFHIAGYAPFLWRAALGRTATAPTADAPVAREPHAAPRARALVGLHGFTLAVFYFFVGRAVWPPPPPWLFPPQVVAAVALFVAAAVLTTWAIHEFSSWRLSAQIERGHALCQSGPYRLLRHPIYAAIDLIALASFLWLPTRGVAVGVLAVFMGGELRARAEERLLVQAFGAAGEDYLRRTKRYVPGVY